MTAADVLAALHDGADPARAVDMRAYHKIDRVYLGLSNALTGELAGDCRKSMDQAALVALAEDLWASNIHEARVVAGKLFIQARMRPDDNLAWDCITGLVPDFDSWAIADAVAMGGQKRLLQDPTRLDVLAGWTVSDHLWTKRAALVFALPFTKSRHPNAVETDARARILGWCAEYAADPQWLIQNALASWLRELSRREPETVARFLIDHGPVMKPFAQKEAARLLPQVP